MSALDVLDLSLDLQATLARLQEESYTIPTQERSEGMGETLRALVVPEGFNRKLWALADSWDTTTSEIVVRGVALLMGHGRTHPIWNVGQIELFKDPTPQESQGKGEEEG